MVNMSFLYLLPSVLLTIFFKYLPCILLFASFTQILRDKPLFMVIYEVFHYRCSHILYLKNHDIVAKSKTRDFKKASAQVPRTESMPLQIETMMRMTEYKIKLHKDYKFKEKLSFHLMLSELLVKWHCRNCPLRQDQLVLFHW